MRECEKEALKWIAYAIGDIARINYGDAIRDLKYAIEKLETERVD